MLLVEGSSQTGPFRHLYDHIFRVRNRNYKIYEGHLFLSKCSKFH